MSYFDIPISDEEVESFGLLEQGIYDFVVIKSQRKTSRANNPMAELQLKVWDKQGVTHTIFDYLIFSNIPMNIKKVKHFCFSTGLKEEYENRKVPEILEGLSGKAEIGIRLEEPKPEGGFYPRKNIVVDYVEKNDKVGTANNEQSDKKEFLDDDIPF